MAYTIVKSDGQVLTTIPDGQLNTTSTSLALPGKNYSGWGQYFDTNFTHLVENFAASEPPANPLRGQLWYNTNNETLCVCPSDGETVAGQWLVLASTSSGGTTTFGAVTVSGNLSANNATITNTLTATDIVCATISVSSVATIQTANIVTANLTTITTGSSSNPGTITGNWSLSSGSRLQSTYADLAERFAADTTYEPGTVVEIGGSKEITAVKYELSDDVFGVISDKVAYLLNAGAGDDNTHPPVAVSGRVYVKVKGPIKKGQRLVSAGQGVARAAKDGEANAFNTIGRALEDKTSEEVGQVLGIVTLR
jgi:hypothetical protein